MSVTTFCASSSTRMERALSMSVACPSWPDNREVFASVNHDGQSAKLDRAIRFKESGCWEIQQGTKFSTPQFLVEKYGQNLKTQTEQEKFSQDVFKMPQCCGVSPQCELVKRKRGFSWDDCTSYSWLWGERPPPRGSGGITGDRLF